MLRIAIFFIVLVCSVFSSPTSPGGRIVGGKDAEISEYPHQASLRDSNGRHFCGCSIIGSNTVLTAAHCVIGTKPTEINIVVGQTFLSGSNAGVPVSKIFIHEKNNAFLNDYDVAILVLKDQLNFENKNIKPIKLAELRPPAGTTATVTGWGATSEGGKGSDQLQSVDVNVVSQPECWKAYTIFLTPTMICAGVPSGGKDSCQGDSGGPLIANGEQIGIVSWGNGCGRKKYPGVYASVADLYNWIVGTANANAI